MSGKKEKKFTVSMSGSFSQEAFAYHHLQPTCDGIWGIMLSTNTPYPINGLGTVLLPLVPFVACPKCQAAYALPGFVEMTEKFISSSMVVSDRMLSAKEIRFLRLVFDLTQQQVVDAIDMSSSVSYYSKCEQGKEPLGSDKQVRLKLFYATKLGVNRVEDYSMINLTSTDRVAHEGTILNLQDAISKEIVKELADQFKQAHHLRDLPVSKQA